MLPFIHHFFATKGPVYAIERGLEVGRRFALGGRRFDRCIDIIERTLAARGAHITFFVSAGMMGRQRHLIKRLQELGCDMGSHGVFHSRMDFHRREHQLRILNDSHRILTDAGFQIRGLPEPVSKLQ